MSRLIYHPPERPFVDFLCGTLDDYPTTKPHTRIFLPAGDVCRFARDALSNRHDVFIYSLDEAATLLGKNAPCSAFADLSPACGRFLVGAFLEKAGILSGEKAAPRFYKLLSEAERLFGDPALLADAAEQEGLADGAGKGAGLFLVLCRYWRDITRDAGYMSAASKRSERTDYWLKTCPPKTNTDRIIAAYMPVADAAVRRLCRYTADTDDGIIICQTAHIDEEISVPPDHPQHYIREAQRLFARCDRLIKEQAKPSRIAHLWFAPAADIPCIASQVCDLRQHMPDARQYPDIFTENSANADRLQKAAREGKTAALVTSDASAAAHIAATLRGKDIEFTSVFDTSPDMTRLYTCLDICFLYADARGRTIDTALHALAAAPLSINSDALITTNTRLTRSMIHTALHEIGATPINNIADMLNAPSWPSEAYPDIDIFWRRIDTALAPLRKTAQSGSAPAAMWYDACIKATAIFDMPVAVAESNRNTPSLADAISFLNKEELRQFQLSPERALSLIKEAVTACFPQADIALTPGVPLICRSEHVRLLAPDIIIFSGLTENGFDRSDTDVYLGRLPDKAALISAESRIARRSTELLGACAAARPVYTCAASGGGNILRPSRAMARLLLLHKIAGNTPEPFSLPLTSCAHDTPPIAGASPALKNRVQTLTYYATDLETAFQNPYIFYAKHLLRLKEPRRYDDDTALSSEFGSVLHEAIEAFSRRLQHTHSADRQDLFISCLRLAAGHRRLRIGNATVNAFIAKGSAVAESFLRDDADERAAFADMRVEETLRAVLALPNQKYIHIRARTDRITCNTAHITDVRVTDIKTGALPAPADIMTGKQVQLAVQSYVCAAAYPNAHITVRAVKYMNDGVVHSKELSRKDAAALPALAESGLRAWFVHIFSSDTDACVFPFTRDIRYKEIYSHLARYEGWRYHTC